MTTTLVNGNVTQSDESAHSAFFQHLSTYPVIQGGLSTLKSSPYGQKSIELSDSAYKTFAQPVLPYLAKPYQYVSPYVKKADSLGDKTLTRVDERFPAIKKTPDELYEDARDLALTPYRVGLAGVDHVKSTFTSSKDKAGGDNVVTYGKALVSTALVITAETLTTVSKILSAGFDKGTNAAQQNGRGSK